MQVVRTYDDTWENLGKLAGNIGAAMLENRVRRGAAKEVNNMLADQRAGLIDENNRAFQGALTDYTNRQQNYMNTLQPAVDAYNANQSGDTWNALVAAGKKVDPNFNPSDANAMTNLMSSISDGSFSGLTPYRNRAQALAQYVMPGADFSSSDWGNTVTQYGNDHASYYRNFKNSNEGKTINGKGNKKYVNYDAYSANDPYNGANYSVVGSFLRSGNPVNIDPSVLAGLIQYVRG